MVFTLATAVFSFVFISRTVASETPVLRYVLTLAGVVLLVLVYAGVTGVGECPNAPREKIRRVPALKPPRVRELQVLQVLTEQPRLFVLSLSLRGETPCPERMHRKQGFRCSRFQPILGSPYSCSP